MGYLHIENLYKNAEILQCFALEKIHGTSAHISFNPTLNFHSGGESHKKFSSLFDHDMLKSKYESNLKDKSLFIYGEAFGGKQQRMSDTYGKQLRFIVFDVKIDNTWLDVPSAEGIAKSFGLEFVPYERGPLTLEWLNAQRDRDSEVAIKPGCQREGIVIRPIREITYNNGDRMIFKHKIAQFRETKTLRDLDGDKLAVLTEASKIADEYVVPMRLEHVLQRVSFNRPEDTRAVLEAMMEDVKREAGDEIVWSKDVERAIGRATAKMLRSLEPSKAD